MSLDAVGWVHIRKGALPTRMNLEKRWPGAAVGWGAGLQRHESAYRGGRSNLNEPAASSLRPRAGLVLRAAVALRSMSTIEPTSPDDCVTLAGGAAETPAPGALARRAGTESPPRARALPLSKVQSVDQRMRLGVEAPREHLSRRPVRSLDQGQEPGASGVCPRAGSVLVKLRSARARYPQASRDDLNRIA